MAAKVDIYWPRAEVVEADGRVTELKVEEGITDLMCAIQNVEGWKGEYGKRLAEPTIEVRGEKGRLKYRIHLTKRVGKRN